MFPEALYTIVSKHEPELDAPEATAESKLPVTVVDNDACVTLLAAKEGRSHFQSGCESDSVADPKGRAVLTNFA